MPRRPRVLVLATILTLEFYTGSNFEYEYPDGDLVVDKRHTSQAVHVNPDC